MKKAANEVDRHVGGRVRMRRMLVGMSQEKLGDALTLTFQQVQKYEKGTNRISATRLREIAGILGVGIDFFYEGIATTGDVVSGFSENVSPTYEADLLTSDGVKLLRAFHRIADANVRRKLIELTASLAGSPEDASTRSD